MTGGMQDVVRQLCTSIEQFDQAAVIASQAQAAADAAAARYSDVLKGTSDPLANGARSEAEIAAAKAGKTAKLFAQAATALTKYVNHIAPGTLPNRAAPGSSPSGEQLPEVGTRRPPLSRRFLGRTVSVKNSDDGLQHLKKLGDAFKDAGSGGTAQPRPTEPVIRSVPQDSTAGSTLLAALTIALVGVKGAEVLVKLRKKSQPQKDASEENRKPHG